MIRIVTLSLVLLVSVSYTDKPASTTTVPSPTTVCTCPPVEICTPSPLTSTNKSEKKNKAVGCGVGDCDCDKGVVELRFKYKGPYDGVQIKIFYDKDSKYTICEYNNVQRGEQITCNLRGGSGLVKTGLFDFAKRTPFIISGPNGYYCAAQYDTSCSQDIVGVVQPECTDLVVSGWRDVGNVDGNDGGDCDDGVTDDCHCDGHPSNPVLIPIKIGDFCYCNTTAPQPTEQSKSKKGSKKKDGSGIGDCDCKGGQTELTMMYLGTKTVDIEFYHKDGAKICTVNDVKQGGEAVCNVLKYNNAVYSKLGTNVFLTLNEADGGGEHCQMSVHTSCSRDIVGTYGNDGHNCGTQMIVSGWKDARDEVGGGCDDGLTLCNCDSGPFAGFDDFFGSDDRYFPVPGDTRYDNDGYSEYFRGGDNIPGGGPSTDNDRHDHRYDGNGRPILDVNEGDYGDGRPVLIEVPSKTRPNNENDGVSMYRRLLEHPTMEPTFDPSLDPTLEPTLSPTTITSISWFQLQNKETGKCVYQNPDGRFSFYRCDIWDDQYWRIDAMDSNSAYFRLKNLMSGQCIENTVAAYYTNPTNPGFWYNECQDNDDGQLWKVINFDGEYFQLKNKKTSRCMYQSNDGRFGISSCWTFNDQFWHDLAMEHYTISGPWSDSVNDAVSVASCLNHESALTSCGIESESGISGRQIDGTTISGDQCIAKTGRYKVRAKARCIRPTPFISEIACTSMNSAWSGGSDDALVNIACSNGVMMGCSIYSDSFHIDGSYPENWWNEGRTTNTYIPFNNQNGSCTARSGGSGTPVHAVITCCSGSAPFECGYSAAVSPCNNVGCKAEAQCPSGYIMTGCSGYSAWKTVASFYIESDICYAEHRGNNVNKPVWSIAICCLHMSTNQSIEVYTDANPKFYWIIALLAAFTSFTVCLMTCCIKVRYQRKGKYDLVKCDEDDECGDQESDASEIQPK